MKLTIVSGTSGAGKSIALQALEDIGFYCIDNLPVALLSQFAGQLIAPNQRGYFDAAVGVDARNLTGDFSQFESILTEVTQTGLECAIFFLDAETDVLLHRFSETRRRHPLTNKGIPLREAIEAERRLLAPVLERCDWRIDTSRTTIHQLRELIRERVRPSGAKGLSLMFQSFGFKRGLPPDADLVFDVRCLPNPHWDPALRAKTGLEDEVRNFLEGQPAVIDMREQIYAFVSYWLPSYERENRSYMTVAIGCTGGHHRSVYLAEHLAQRFRQDRNNVLVRHRELS